MRNDRLGSCPAGALIDLTIDRREGHLMTDSQPRPGTLLPVLALVPFLVTSLFIASDISVFNGRQLLALILLGAGWATYRRLTRKADQTSRSTEVDAPAGRLLSETVLREEPDVRRAA
jgi:hypothetical protein